MRWIGPACLNGAAHVAIGRVALTGNQQELGGAPIGGEAGLLGFLRALGRADAKVRRDRAAREERQDQKAAERCRHREQTDTFRGWLHGVTRHRLLEHFRRLRRHIAAAGGTDAQAILLNKAALPEEPDEEEQVLCGQPIDGCWSNCARSSSRARGTCSGGA